MVKRCLDGMFCVMVGCAVLGLLLFLLPEFFRIKPQIVLSGSMEPEISVGSMAYIATDIPPEDICETDIIAYKMGEEMDVLHRVIRVEEEEKAFQTKGDANEEADLGMVRFDQYKGKELFCIPYVGYLVQFFQKGHGVLWTVLLLAGLLMIDFIWKEKEGSE